MKKANILILDEKLEASVGFERLLKAGGYMTYHARTLHDAFQHAKLERPDIIVVGDTFHKHSGIEICEELRSEIDTCYANIILFVPVIDKSIRERAQESGVNEIIQRNIDGEEFMKRIESVLPKS